MEIRGQKKKSLDGHFIANIFTYGYRDTPAYRDRGSYFVCHGYHLDCHVVHDDHLQLFVKMA